MRLCFGSLIRILRYCSKHGVTNKVICAAVIKSINERYSFDVESDDGIVGHLFNCSNNLSPVQVVACARDADLAYVSQSIRQNVLPLLDEGKIKLAIYSLKEVALSDTIDDDAYLGRMKYSDLKQTNTFNPSDFIGDIFIYTAATVDNKSGVSSIKEITKELVNSFKDKADEITLSNDVVIEMSELSCTLDDSDFDVVFREVEHSETLQLSNSSELKLYYLDIIDSAFDYNSISEYLLECTSMYVYNRTQIKDFQDRNKVRSMGVKALRKMQENGSPDERGTGNELGEMLLFTFMEGALHAPKLLSKVEIVTSAREFHSKSDSVHLLKRKINGATSYQLVFGTSSINGQITAGIDQAFSTLCEIKSSRRNERSMVDSTLLNRTYDAETTARLRQILIPSPDHANIPDMAFGVFIGYSLGIECDNNDEFRTLAILKMKEDIAAAAPYIVQKIRELNLGMHSYYFYFLPFNNAENDKRQIMSDLMGGPPE